MLPEEAAEREFAQCLEVIQVRINAVLCSAQQCLLNVLSNFSACILLHYALPLYAAPSHASAKLCIIWRAIVHE